MASPRTFTAAGEPSDDAFRIAFENNPVPMWLVDAETLRFLEVNSAAVEQYGWSRDEFLDMTIADIRPSEDVPDLRAVVNGLPQNPHSGIWRHRKKSGELIEVQIFTFAMNRGGRAVAVTTASNVTRDRADRRKLEDSERHFRLLFERNPMPMFLYEHRQLRVVDVNEAMVRKYGYPREELIGMGIAKLHLPEDIELVKRRIATPTEQIDEEEIYRHVAKGGRILNVKARRLELGEIRLVLIEDITEQLEVEHEREDRLMREREARRRAEEAKRRSDFLAEASSLLARSLDFRKTAETLARLAVPAFADWCTFDVVAPDGALRREVMLHADPGRQCLLEELTQRYVPQLRSQHSLARALNRGEASYLPEVSAETLAQMSSDERHRELLHGLGMESLVVVPLVARGRTIGALAFVRGGMRAGDSRYFSPEDFALITELAHRAALSLDNAKLYNDAQLAVRIRDEFMSIASHEFKTPLTALLGYLQFVQMRARKPGQQALPDDLGEMLESAEAQSRRMLRLVNDLLDVARIRSGKFGVQRGRHDLSRLCLEVGERLKASLAQSGCVLSVEAEPGIFALFDPARMEQVVTNLLSNAAKYGRGKPVELKVGRSAPGLARITVRDRGIGIAPAQFEKIFERFERLVSSQEYSGLGLGLYIVKQIIQAHGGTVRVESHPGEGATFIVELAAWS